MSPYHKPEPCWLPDHDHDWRDCPTPDRLWLPDAAEWRGRDRLFDEQETA